EQPGPESGLGGTLAYMAPEHLDAFLARAGPDSSIVAAAVDTRSDVFSLGVVLFELLTGSLPFPRRPAQKADAKSLIPMLPALARERRAGPRALPDEVEAPPALRRICERCLVAAPEDRFADAAELSGLLDGCREARRMEKELPTPGRLTHLALRHPFLMA